jgi:signal transduction histidine kinase
MTTLLLVIVAVAWVLILAVVLACLVAAARGDRQADEQYRRFCRRNRH